MNYAYPQSVELRLEIAGSIGIKAAMHSPFISYLSEGTFRFAEKVDRTGPLFWVS